ncbi:YwaF family protein [Romboutsia sedimentorum]|uniref:YwaF family protein n=1 Tax=Romboutsia sedimentorum TaxID=1368474 RepID=A0ABT7E8L5_9FIRM|nr:YwaF family protein [Romboutsia sedimentorum]MDK2563266.1 YwaF family protein [Romboutsia sedimentorum]
MTNTFLFSREHLIILFIFAIFMYFCNRLTKNLLPYSYIIEKIICWLIILEIVFEQVSIISMGNYNTSSSLPIGISRFCAYICIAILFFKQYHLFNVFFSWSLVCSIGEIILFKEIPYRFPNILYFLFIFSKVLLIYANVYMIEVRKFKINKYAIRDNLIACILYFSFILLLNIITSANYSYSFSELNLTGILVFFLITTAVYIPIFISDKEIFKFKR